MPELLRFVGRTDEHMHSTSGATLPPPPETTNLDTLGPGLTIEVSRWVLVTALVFAVVVALGASIGIYIIIRRFKRDRKREMVLQDVLEEEELLTPDDSFDRPSVSPPSRSSRHWN